MKHVRLELSEELHKALKMYTVENGTTIIKTTVEALEKFLKEKGYRK